MKRKALLLGVSLALLLIVKGMAFAANPYLHYFDCKNCHFANATMASMSADHICLKCHSGASVTAPNDKLVAPLATALDPTGAADGKPGMINWKAPSVFSTGDASNKFGHNPAPGAQTSHNWAASNIQPAAGAGEPLRTTYTGFYSRYGASLGKVTCSRCHNPHGEAVIDADSNYDPVARTGIDNPLGNPKLLIPDAQNANKPMDPEKMCRACHATYAAQGPGNHGLVGHPVNSTTGADTYASVIASQPTKYKATPAAPAAPYDQSYPVLVDGKVTCLSCHNMHYVDSDSTTADGVGQTLNSGDGNLLRGDGAQHVNDPVRSTTFCNSCHQYATGFHGTGASAIGCIGCHGGHNNTSATPSYYMLNGNFTTLPTTPAERAQVWGGTQAGVLDGFCETCHGNIEQNFPTLTPSLYGHTASLTQCDNCHQSHASGAFSQPIGCDGCHGSPPAQATAGNPDAPDYVATAKDGYAWVSAANNYKDGSTHYKDETLTPHFTHSGATSTYKYDCKVCHNTHFNNFATTHNQGVTSYRDVLETGATNPYDVKASGNGAMTPSYADATGDCANVYCHSNGGVNNGTGTRAGYNPATPGWDGTRNTITCASCHGNDATTMGATGRVNSAAHIKHLNAGFSCNVCHVNTATDATTLKAGAAGTTHINVAVDVAFDTASVLKAGGAAMSNGTGPWNGANDTTCDAVYCHSTGLSDPGSRTYRSINWTSSTALTCTSCHDIAGGTGQTAAHAAHVNGSTSDLGRNLDCGVCHADTVTVGDNAAITGAGKHVNGLVDIKMNVFGIDTTTCGNISCHSDGNFETGATLTYKNVAWTGAPLAGCDDCHGNGAGSSYPSYANGGVGVDSNSHGKHVGGGIVCAECHSQTTASNTAIDGADKTKHVNRVADVSGAKIESYTTDGTETCAAAACHGGGAPQWGGTVACGSCHAANNTLGQSHSRHYEAATAGDYTVAANSSVAGSYVIQCGVCHSPNGAGAISHAGGWVDDTAPDRRTAQVNFDGTIASGTYTAGTAETADGTFYYTDATCAAFYCHGNFGGNGNAATATWGVAASGACGTCHDVDSSATMDGGSHSKHVKVSGITCDYCHGATAVNAAGGIADKALHVNRALNWDFAAAGKPQTAGATYAGAATGTIAAANVGIAANYTQCANLYCHSTVQAAPPNGTVGVVYSTPTWGGAAACGSCHKGDAVGVEQDSGSHIVHVAAAKYAKPCSACHDNAGSGTASHANYEVNVNINTSYNRAGSASYGGTLAPGDAYGSCTNLTCHSNGQGGDPLVVPTWNTSLGCTGCHDNANATTTLSAAHKAHTFGATATVGRDLGCEQCHADTVSDSTTLNATTGYAVHVDGGKTIKVAIDNSTCNNIRCHGDGNFDGTVAYNNPAWNTALGCDSCHGALLADGKAFPDYADGGAGTGASNSHNKHVGIGLINCEECHATTSVDGTSINGTTPANHVNQAVEVSFKQGGAIDASETCSATYCHGDGTPQWGGPALACDACHSASSALANSHGAHYQSATVATANNTTNATTAGAYVFACGNCHLAASTNHAGGKVSADQTAQVAFSGGGTYTAGALVAADRGFNYTAGTCASTACHNDGTAAQGAPNTTATWNGTLPADCTGCHNNNKAAGAGKIMASNAHGAHVNDGTIMSDKACETCHTVTVDATDRAIADKTAHVNGARNVDIDAAWDSNAAPADNWTVGTLTCASVYCHSDGKATPTYQSVAWNTTIGDCVSCHQGASAGTTLSGAHQAHVVNATATIGRTLGCADCHGATVSGNTTISTPANHVNKAVDVMSCATIDCHSNGNYGATLIHKAPTWTASYTCDSCHGDDATDKAYPAYANAGVGNADANSHEKHVVGAGAKCGECHAETSTGNGTAPNFAIDGTTPALHVNGVVNVSGAKIGSFSLGTCATVSCHGGNSADWGDTLGCRDCHGNATADADNFAYNDGTFAKVAIDEWTFSGHGTSAASTYEVTGRNGADLDTAAGTGDGCLYCHDGSVSHGAANLFRLRQNGQPDLNGACLGCHATGSAGVDPDGAGAVYANKDSSVKVDKYHGGAKHNGTDRDAGRWCWDCHDPHGDADVAGLRIQMLQRNPQVNPDANGVPASLATTDIIFTDRAVGAGAGGFARASGVFAEGICNSCHTTTAQYTQTLGDNGHPTGQCTVCHKHSSDTTYNGEAFKGAGCSGCHGDAATDRYWPDGSGAHPDDNAGRHQKHMEVIAAKLGYALATANDAQQKEMCGYCHAGPGVTNHADGTVNVSGMLKLWDATADDGAFDTAGDGGNGTCATVDCHNNKTTPAGYSWDGATLSACIMCHSDVTVETTHSQHLAADSTYGRVIDCASCHDAATSWASNTKPASNHINGAFLVSGNVSFTYGGTYPSAKGSCGTNTCHNNGRNGAPANNSDGTTYPDYDWSIRANNGCSFCHLHNTNNHNTHFSSGADLGGIFTDSFISLSGGAGCNACHTHSGNVAAHIDAQVTIAAGMTYSSSAASLQVSGTAAPGTCTTTTCHNDGANNGAGAAVVTPLWDRTADTADNCTLCHAKGTAKGVPATGSHAKHVDLVAADTALASYTSQPWTTTSAEYKFNCTTCHGSTLANHLKGSVNVAVPGWTANATAGDTCGTNDCHNDGTAAKGAPVSDPATWGTTPADTCAICHGNSPSTNAHGVHVVGIHSTDIYSGTDGLLGAGSATAPSGHGDGNSTTLNCNICHSQTVTNNANDKNPACASCHDGTASGTLRGKPTLDKTKHLDSNKRVVFALSGFKSKAQLRDSLAAAATVDGAWTRTTAYKSAAADHDVAKVQAAPSAPQWASNSCSNIACHNNIAATWQAPANNCMACHTQLPK